MHLFEVSPNCSLTPRSAVMFFLAVAVVVLTIGVGFALAGYWPILPFAGLEVLVLGLALRAARQRGRERDYIRLDDEHVLVRQHRKGTVIEHRFARAWTQVELQDPRARNWPSRLILRSMGRSVEIGAFLTESERLGLRRRLAELLDTR